MMQLESIDKPGYVPNENLSICKKCFRSKNYGEFSNNLNIFYTIDKIKEIKDDNVIMIIDIMNPYETFIEGINKFVSPENLTILVNKIDSIPKSVPKESILDWISEIADLKNIKFSQLALVSSIKKINIDAISSFILNSERNTSIIGYSNVGKSSIITTLFNSLGLSINNLITNSIGTTKEIIELSLKDKIIKDYPGIFLEGSYQNLMTISQLKDTHPKKEIKVTNYQLDSMQSISIGNYAYFNILESDKKMDYQFSFSNIINLKRTRYREENPFKSIPVKHTMGKKYDIIISGLGIITFKSKGQKLSINLPKGVKFNIIDSLYQ